MTKPTTLLAALALIAGEASAALADAPSTTSAQTLVVVTPAAPIVVAGGSAGPVLAPVSGAPQTDAWSSVSHINGRVVPVGERGDYLYALRRTNLALNPIGLVLGYYDASVARALTPNLALSGSITATDRSGESFVDLVVSAPLYFRRAFSGPFVEPGLVATSRETVAPAVLYTAPSVIVDGPSAPTRESFASFEVMLGWQWSFDSGLNAAFAFGASRRLDGAHADVDDVAPAGYLRVGYAL